MQVTEVDIAQKISGCARFGVAFKYRPSKKYCSANCRKRANEPKQNSFSSKKVRHENERRLERAKWLGIEYYRTPPRFRFSFIFELIEQAIRLDDKQLIAILTNFKMLNAHPRHDPKFFPTKNHSDQNIAQIAQQFSLLVHERPIKIYISEQRKLKSVRVI